MTSHLQSSPQPILFFFFLNFSLYFFFNSFFLYIELENLFNAINAPDDGGEEKVEETRSLKPVRIPINLLTVVLLFLKGLERFPGRVFIYLRFKGKMSISFLVYRSKRIVPQHRTPYPHPLPPFLL